MKGFGAQQAAVDASGLNTLTWLLAIGPFEKDNNTLDMGLDVIDSPIESFDLNSADYVSRCLLTIDKYVEDGVMPQEPPEFIEGGSGRIPNPAHARWQTLVRSMQISFLIADQATYLNKTQTQRIQQDFCRTKYASDVGSINMTIIQQTLEMIEKYRVRLAEYITVFAGANFPCRTAKPEDHYIGTSDGFGLGDVLGTSIINLFGTSAPDEISVMGCQRVDRAIISALNRDRLLIKQNIMMIDSMQHWLNSATAIEKYGNPVYGE